MAEVITHELAHQWFGNLVTMVWWDDLWLNEAFATWMAFKIVDQWRPEWRVFRPRRNCGLRWLSMRNSARRSLAGGLVARPSDIQLRRQQRLRQAFSFLAYDFALIFLTYAIEDMMMKLLCAALSMLTAVRAIQLFSEALLNSPLLEAKGIERFDDPLSYE